MLFDGKQHFVYVGQMRSIQEFRMEMSDTQNWEHIYFLIPEMFIITTQNAQVCTLVYHLLHANFVLALDGQQHADFG